MDYDTQTYFPIERDPYGVPDQHFTYADGVSRAGVNGDQFKALRAANMLKVQSAKHARSSHTG